MLPDIHARRALRFPTPCPPLVLPPPPHQEELLEEPATSRRVPEWGQAIFSPLAVCTTPESPEGLMGFIDYCVALTRAHIMVRPAPRASAAADPGANSRRRGRLEWQRRRAPPPGTGWPLCPVRQSSLHPRHPAPPVRVAARAARPRHQGRCPPHCRAGCGPPAVCCAAAGQPEDVARAGQGLWP